MELNEIGSYDDEATGLPGVRRLALTDADAEARRRCVHWMTEAGLEVRVDRIGNVYATGSGATAPCRACSWAPTSTPSRPAERSTAPSACSAASRVMRTLNDAGIETLRDIEVGFFTEEEGVRFDTDMLGSAVTAGRILLDHAHKLTDADGKTVKEELERIRFDGPSPSAARSRTPTSSATSSRARSWPRPASPSASSRASSPSPGSGSPSAARPPTRAPPPSAPARTPA